MNKKYDVILFDMDGTIANTDRLILESFYKLYDKFNNGVRRSDEEIYYFSGPPIKETLKVEFPEYAHFNIDMPSEYNRRVGQSIAAASLAKSYKSYVSFHLK